LGATRQDFVSVDIEFSSSSSYLSLLNSMDVIWPSVPLEYCHCQAAHLSTCLRPRNDRIDRSVWPTARLTLVEWNPSKKGYEYNNLVTDVVAMENLYVFHFQDQKRQALCIFRRGCLSPPVPIIYPFIGTKLHLSSNVNSYVKLEISNKSDLPEFMNTMLYTWGEMI
ncbi:hypothetical protein PMAYCL1PPCAC_24411, partial [Pristionchus mayeri]